MVLAAVAVMAGYVALAAPREPVADRGFEVEAVTVLDPNATTYKLEPPFRVLRGGRVTEHRHEEAAPLPVVRVDLIIDGEHVVVFTRRRE
jgi:hypothetical protein